MASADELLRKLDERFVLGEISEEQYRQVRPRLEAQVTVARSAVQVETDSGDGPSPGNVDLPSGGAPATAGGMSIADSVIKGNVTSGSASVGNINIHVGGKHDGSDHELEYEKFVLLVLRSGGQLDTARKDLDERRVGLGLSIRLAKEIERACLEACGRLPSSTTQVTTPSPAPAGPDAVTRFFKSASESIASMFATPKSVQPTGPVQGAPAAQPGAAAPVPPPIIASAPAAPKPPPVVQGTSPLNGPPAPAAKPPPLEAALKSEIRAEVLGAIEDAQAELTSELPQPKLVDVEQPDDDAPTRKPPPFPKPPPLVIGTPPPLPKK